MLEKVTISSMPIIGIINILIRIIGVVKSHCRPSFGGARSEWEEIPFHFLRCFVAISRAALMYVPGTMILVMSRLQYNFVGRHFYVAAAVSNKGTMDRRDDQPTRSRARVGTAHRKMAGNSLTVWCVIPSSGLSAASTYSNNNNDFVVQSFVWTVWEYKFQRMSLLCNFTFINRSRTTW